jgi:hypothetical protein
MESIKKHFFLAAIIAGLMLVSFAIIYKIETKVEQPKKPAIIQDKGVALA